MILLLEDNLTFCNILTDYLKIQGFEIEYCKTVNKAIEKLDEYRNKINLCLIDVLLNGKSGFNFVEYLHNFNNKNNYDIKYCFLTGCHKDMYFYHRIVEIMGSEDGKRYCYSYIVKTDFITIKSEFLNILNKFK